MPCTTCTDEAKCDRLGLCQHVAHVQLPGPEPVLPPASQPHGGEQQQVERGVGRDLEGDRHGAAVSAPMSPSSSVREVFPLLTQRRASGVAVAPEPPAPCVYPNCDCDGFAIQCPLVRASGVKGLDRG